jgi:hypothetical protein
MLSYTFNNKEKFITAQHIETRPGNRHSTGENKGVLQTAMAHIVGEAKKRGWLGDIGFTAKTTGKGSQGTLIDYYKKTLGARSYGQTMVIMPEQAENLYNEWGI